MATLIPDPLAKKSTHGEKEFAKLLKRLPEDWMVYYEPRIGGLRPDFVILAPRLGVLIVEVKDWKMRTVKALNPQSVSIQATEVGQPKQQANPLQQVDRYWQSVIHECEACLFGQSLLNNKGKWQGRLCFPVGAVVLFNNISLSDVEKSSHRSV